MIKGKVKVFDERNYVRLENSINGFLETIDIRQVIKTEFSTTNYNSTLTFCAIIYYVGIEDIRDAKIEGILDVKWNFT